jgi:GNAT superfamily N-acetyltransferase
LIRQHAAFEQSAASLTLPELEDILRADQHPIRFLVADRGDRLIGYAAVTFDWSAWRARRYAHLDCLFVVDASRGSGIGRLLLAEATRVALAGGVDRMEWQTPAWNEDAVRFYVREGAHIQSKTRFSLRLAWADNEA